jgi:hypothetical protein
MMWSARQRPFYSVDGEPEDGDGASGDDVGVCVPHHGPATDCHVSCGAFFTARSGGDRDERTIMTYIRPAQLLGLDSGSAFLRRLVIGDDRDTVILG